MKLFYSPGACSLSPHITLREAGAQFELERVDLRAKTTQAGADYRALNPKGYVPALLLDDGQILTEGPVIVQYVADRYADAKLAPPAGTLERYRMMEWLSFIASEIHKPQAPLFKPQTSDAEKQETKDLLRRRFAILDRGLGDKPYLLESGFSVADPYAYYVLRVYRKYGSSNLDEFPLLKAYFDRVASRPSVHAALEAEGLSY